MKKASAVTGLVAGAGIWLLAARDRRKAALDNIQKFLDIVRSMKVRL